MLWVETKQLKDPQEDSIAQDLKNVIYSDFRNFRTLKIDDPEFAGEVAALAEKAEKNSLRRP